MAITLVSNRPQARMREPGSESENPSVKGYCKGVKGYRDAARAIIGAEEPVHWCGAAEWSPGGVGIELGWLGCNVLVERLQNVVLCRAAFCGLPSVRLAPLSTRSAPSWSGIPACMFMTRGQRSGLLVGACAPHARLGTQARLEPRPRRVESGGFQGEHGGGGGGGVGRRRRRRKGDRLRT